MAIGVIHIFQVIQIHHDESGRLQDTASFAEQMFHDPVKSPSVQKARQQIMIPLMLDRFLLHHRTRDIFNKTDTALPIIAQRYFDIAEGAVAVAF